MFVLFTIALISLVVLIVFDDVEEAEKNPYNLSPISDFILYLDKKSIEEIDNILYDDTEFIYNEETLTYKIVRDNLISLFDENEVEIGTSDFYGHYHSKRKDGSKQAVVLLRTVLKGNTAVIEILFTVDLNEKITSLNCSEIGFSYLFMTINGREQILEELSK